MHIQVLTRWSQIQCVRSIAMLAPMMVSSMCFPAFAMTEGETNVNRSS